MPKASAATVFQKLMTYNSTCECMETVGWYSDINGQKHIKNTHTHKWGPFGDRRDLRVLRACLFHGKESTSS